MKTDKPGIVTPSDVGKQDECDEISSFLQRQPRKQKQTATPSYTNELIEYSAMMTRPDSLATHYDGIDCLRGLAILLVVIHHFALRFPLTATDLAHVLPFRLLRALNWGGIKGVTMFFVISGFLITHHTLMRWGRPSHLDLFAFMSRRGARIMPCLLALIIIACGLGALGVPSFVPENPGQSLGRAAFSAIFMHLNLYEGQTGYLPAYWDVLWSLSVEELFYLGFPLICLTLGRTRETLLLCAGVLALAAPWCDWSLRHAPEIWQEKAYGPGMSAIATGVVAALMTAYFGSRKTFLTITGVAGLAGTGLYLLRGDLVWSFLGWGTSVFFNVSIALSIWAFAHEWGTCLTQYGTRWLRRWGQRSYEIYLSHMFVIMPVVALMQARHFPAAQAWLVYPPVLLVVFLLGSVIEARFSRPLDRRFFRFLSDLHTRPIPARKPR